MNRARPKWVRWLVACSALVVLLAAIPPAAMATPPTGGRRFSAPFEHPSGGIMASMQPDWGRRAHRLYTRGDHILARFGETLGDIGLFWLGLVVSIVGFVAVVAVSSVADVRMFTLWWRNPDELSRYFGRGLRMFFDLVRDRHTPHLARLLLVMGLVYWLLPTDFIPDSSLLPGFADDIVIAVVAAKVFMYLCPDSLVAQHASEVQAKAHA